MLEVKFLKTKISTITLGNTVYIDHAHILFESIKESCWLGTNIIVFSVLKGTFAYHRTSIKTLQILDFVGKLNWINIFKALSNVFCSNQQATGHPLLLLAYIVCGVS